MNPVRITCRACAGLGQVDLNGSYLDTLVVLRKHGESTGAELARAVGCKGTAMNNRLAALEQMGLASSRRYGQKRFYKAT